MKAKLNRYAPFITAGFLFSSGIVTLLIWCSSADSWSIREQLKSISPLTLELNFMLILSLLTAAVFSLSRYGYVRRLRAACSVRCRIMLAVILSAGFVLVVFCVPRESRIYYDEQIYQNIGQTICCTKGAGSHAGEGFSESFGSFWKRFTGQAGMCNEGRNEFGEYTCHRLEYNKEPNGWPYVLSIAYRIFGVNERVSFACANFMYLASILAVFGIGSMLFGSCTCGTYAALVFALTPQHLMWSNTAAAEPSAAFFPALALLCALLFVKTGSTWVLLLAAAMTAFASQFRPESGMICAVVGLTIVLMKRSELKRGRLYAAAGVLFVLLVPHFAHLYAVKGMGWGSSGAKFAFSHFPENFRVNALFYLRNMRYPLIFTLLALGSLLFRTGSGRAYGWPQKAVLLVWFMLFWGIFLFFYAGSYNYGADVRFSLLSSIPLAVLAGFGAWRIAECVQQRISLPGAHAVMALLLTGSFLSFMPLVRAVTQEAWAARADVHYAKEMAQLLPEESVVLTHNPNMFLMWGYSAAQASLATEHRAEFRRFFHRYKGGVYFHYNFWCNVDDPLQNSFCENILNRYDATEVASYAKRNYRYALYRIERKKRLRRSSGD